MLSDMGRRPMIGKNDGSSFSDELEPEIGFLLHEQRRKDADDLEKELNLYRSGSAPPTVEGSLSAVGGLFGYGGGGASNNFSGFSGNNNKNGNGILSEEDVRSNPDYLSYYYSKGNMNPRLPPPLLSKEDWRSAQRLKGTGSSLGGIGDRRKVNNVSQDSNNGGRSLFSQPPGFNSRKEESNEAETENLGGSAEWGGDGLIGLSGIGLGSKQKSYAEIFQNDLGHTTPVLSHTSRPSSRNTFEENVEHFGSAEAEIVHLRREMTPSNSQNPTAVQSIGPPASYTYAAAVGASLSRSTTPDPQLLARASSPSITPIGGGRNLTPEKRGVNSPGPFSGVQPSFSESAELVAALSGMSLSGNVLADEEKHFPSQLEQEVQNIQNSLFNQNHLKQHSYLNKSSESGHLNNNNIGNSYLKGSSTSNFSGGGHYQHPDTLNSSYQNYGLSGYGMNPAVASMMASQFGNGTLPPLFENVAAASAMGGVPGMDYRMLGGGLGQDTHSLNNRIGNNNHMSGSALQQAPFMDPSYLAYLRQAEYAATQVAALNDPNMDMNYFGNSYLDIVGLQKAAYLGNLLSPQKSQYGNSIGSKSSGSHNQGYYGNPSFGVGVSYPGSPLASPLIPNSPVGQGSPMHFNSGMRNVAGGLVGSWHLDSGMNESFSSSLLEEFKSNKTKCFELSEIAGHVVEFSADQYGSRFIQQKLETATVEEKNMVYQEIYPQSLSLMTDVFGNYVIQKFFEHGMANQRRELASKLYGNVLSLSLQMYGCRVIQKAIEVVDLDQKIIMVEELDGHIMRCVRDQNGNHVIQKCIECVPEEAIQFIITTFFDQVVHLSTHPYGCRVIQRVLEHCMDPETQRKVMDEVLACVSMLAQDQYGNYVVQHVLEHGKPHERSTIIKELVGNIVQMSQQKFASNVVEKCLTFGSLAERQLLVVEMLGTTDENEPLQAMMKDQFANYVVQKVLETCDDQQRELILTRIKIHLNALKKYTYGKHIVARVEKLVAAGERRIACQTLHPAASVA